MEDGSNHKNKHTNQTSEHAQQDNTSGATNPNLLAHNSMSRPHETPTDPKKHYKLRSANHMALWTAFEDVTSQKPKLINKSFERIIKIICVAPQTNTSQHKKTRQLQQLMHVETQNIKNAEQNINKTN